MSRNACIFVVFCVVAGLLTVAPLVAQSAAPAASGSPAAAEPPCKGQVKYEKAKAEAEKYLADLKSCCPSIQKKQRKERCESAIAKAEKALATAAKQAGKQSWRLAGYNARDARGIARAAFERCQEHAQREASAPKVEPSAAGSPAR